MPTLHEVLQSAFLSVSSGLLTVGAICSAVFKKKGAYAFFYSHCHGHNGLSATDGASSLITFSSLDDLVRYMNAFYDSMKLDTSMQYDFLPINVKKSQNKQSYKDEMAHHMESYFNDQRLRHAKKSQNDVRTISIDLSSIAFEKSKKALWAKRKEFRDRSEYFKIYRRKCRQNSAFKGKERDSKQSAKSDPAFRAKEKVYQKESKQAARKDSVFKTKERESKQSARQNPVFRAKESVYQKESNKLQEKILSLKQKKKNQSNLPDKILYLEPKKVCIKKNQNKLQEKILSLKQKKENQSNLPDKILYLGPKKVCIRKNQSNLQEKILSLKQKKENQSNLPDKILYLGPKKVCIRKNQSNLPDKILYLKLKKVCIRKNQSNLQEKILSSN